jgi:hypothetical protein
MHIPMSPTIKISGTTSTDPASITVLEAEAGTRRFLFRPICLYVDAAALITFKSGETTLLTPFRLSAAGDKILWPISDIGDLRNGIQMEINFDAAPSAVAYWLACYHAVDASMSHFQ